MGWCATKVDTIQENWVIPLSEALPRKRLGVVRQKLTIATNVARHFELEKDLMVGKVG